uniref:lipopolysaccharide core heptose(II)-phosphate phosphatase PmrG n=1 Tax=Pseudomonas sp. RW407 TaxID=2202894 RepID=UPI002113972F|nr:histidine phosphatase family protein [Pseudomonas sp. RW407]
MIPLKLRRNFTGRWVSLVAIFVASLGLSGFFPSPPLAPPSLLRSAASQALFREHWRNGDLIVLVRHAERCDHADAPCLSSAQGITARAQPVARELGHAFEALGASDVDIVSSPLIRAEQTAENMFGKSPLQQAWLFNCRGAMLSQVLQHKAPHRNLILVTHSECIQDLESSMGNPHPTMPAYASSLFLVDDGKGAPSLLGYLDADQWNSIVSTR